MKQWRKIKKVDKSNAGKNIWDKYHLPLTMARRLLSYVQDFSPALLTNVRHVLENWRKPNFRPSATPSLIFFSFWMWSVVVPAEGVVPPRVLTFRYPNGLGSAAPPCVWTWKTCPPLQRGSGFLLFRHWSWPWRPIGMVAQEWAVFRSRLPYPSP